MTEPRRVGILAFPDMEVLDYAGPFEVFNVAGELVPGSFVVRSIAVAGRAVVARGGFTVVADATIADGALPDLLVIPGGAGSRRLLADGPLLTWVREAESHVELIASVCTGALLLGAAGLLANRPATTHHDAVDELRAASPSTKVRPGARFVRSAEHIWTSAGVSAGIDLSLHLVEHLRGPEARRVVAAEMEWGWGDSAAPRRQA